MLPGVVHAGPPRPPDAQADRQLGRAVALVDANNAPQRPAEAHPEVDAASPSSGAGGASAAIAHQRSVIGFGSTELPSAENEASRVGVDPAPQQCTHGQEAGKIIAVSTPSERPISTYGAWVSALLRRYPYGLLSRGLHAAGSIVVYGFRIVQLLVIAGTICNLPSFASRTRRYLAVMRRKKLAGRVWRGEAHSLHSAQHWQSEWLSKWLFGAPPHSSAVGTTGGMSGRPSSRPARIADLPSEIILAILDHTDFRSICRMARTSRRMNAIAQDNSLWRARFLQDWKLRTIDLSMSATPWSSDTAPDTCGENRSRSGGCNDYRSLYKIRWFTSPRRREMLSFEERALREGFFGAVVWDDFYEAMQRCYHLLVTPLKLVDSLVDLVQEARLCFNFHDMQVFCLLNMTSLVVLFMHELAIAIASVNCGLVFVASGAPARWLGQVPAHLQTYARWLVWCWQLAALPALILFHIQLVLIPWSLVNDRSLHHLLTGAPLRINETLLFEILSGCCAWLRLDLVLTHVRQLSPLVSTLTLQILWAPVVCTVEELVFQYTKEELRGMDGPLMAAHNFIRVFTLCFQCCFGAAAYAGLVAVWTIQRRRLL